MEMSGYLSLAYLNMTHIQRLSKIGTSLFKNLKNGVSFNIAYSCINLLINESELSGKINVKS